MFTLCLHKEMHWQSKDSISLIVCYLMFHLVNTLMESIKEHLRNYFNIFIFILKFIVRLLKMHFATKFI